MLLKEGNTFSTCKVSGFSTGREDLMVFWVWKDYSLQGRIPGEKNYSREQAHRDYRVFRYLVISMAGEDIS